MNKYLLAIDGSENSSRATNYLLNLAQITGLDITVIHVVNSRKEIYNYSPLMDIQDIKNVITKQGHQLLNECAAVFEEKELKVTKVIVEGDPGFEIAEYAKRNDISHIVLGTRGLSDLKGLIMGSVSHQVIYFAQCPITLVK